LGSLPGLNMFLSRHKHRYPTVSFMRASSSDLSIKFEDSRGRLKTVKMPSTTEEIVDVLNEHGFERE